MYRIIKRKRNLRRLSAVWLFLLVIELFCPVLCDEPAFAAELNCPQSATNLSVADKDESPDLIAASSDSFQSTDNHEAFCNDECLCHAVAIPSLNKISLKELSFRRDAIALRYGKPLFNSLPPPFQPPKNS